MTALDQYDRRIDTMNVDELRSALKREGRIRARLDDAIMAHRHAIVMGQYVAPTPADRDLWALVEGEENTPDFSIPAPRDPHVRPTP